MFLTDKELKTLFVHQLETEMRLLNKTKKKFQSEIDKIDTEIIGIKEELLKRKLEEQNL